MRHIQLAVLICSLCILCNAIDDKKKCTPYRTCADCIVKGGGDCYYCADEDFQKTNTRQPRCNTMVELTKANCKSISPEKTDLAVTKNDSLTDTNQVQPQQVTLKLRVGQPAKFKIKVKPTKNYPVDLYYLMDLSNSMKDDKGNLTRLAEDLAAAIGKITTNYRLGFGSFVDKPVAPYIRLDLKDKPCDECAATFGFKHSMTFQKDVKLFKDAVEKQMISSNLDSPEGGFDALMQASVCKNEIGWKNVDEARRIIIFVTDAYPHIAGDGRLGGIITPNDGQCHMSNGKYTKSETMDYPSIAFLASKMKEHKILPIIATTSEVMNVYSKISEEWKDIGAVAAELKGDSSNIVELVKDAYTKISQTVRVTTNDAPADIKVTAESNCGGGDGSDTCTNVRPGEDDVEFDISVTAQIRLCENGAKGDKKDFTINVAGFGEVKVNYEAICECDCKSKGVPKSPKCTNRGSYACGICYCDEGRFGPTCNCTDATAADNTLCMLNATDPNEKVCSGFGRCICGKCECDKDDANPEHVISGTYCQCNNFGCELHRGLLCGGPDRGQCECGKCRCAGDYVGTNCGSRNCTIAAKDCIKDGKVCSGNGKCGCGKCVCDTGYNGNHCERCVSCPGKCKTVRDCVLCQAFSGEGVEPKSICDTCNLNLKFVNQSEECSIQVNATCYVQYHFENDLTKLVNETIFVQREKRCPPYSLTTQALEQLNGTTVRTDNVKETSERLKQTVVRGNITVPVDIKLVSDVLTNIVKVNVSDSEVADNVIQTVSEVLNASPDLIGESEIQYQSSQSILKQLDDLAKSQVVGRGGQVVRKSQNLALLAFRNSALKNVTVFSPDFSSSKMSGNISQIDLQQINGALNDSQIFNQDATAFLPSSLFNLASEYGDFVHAFVFNNSNLFLTPNQLKNVTGRKMVTINRTVQSRVLSVTVGQRKITKLLDVVSMTFRKNIVFPEGYDKEICHFWDESKATDIPGVVGGWSSEGCVTVLLENGQFVRCECDHLTNFALILDTSQTGLNILALKVVTWIGCAISIASLVLTILTFLIFRKTLLTGKLPPKILIGLCFSLLCTMIIFLAGVEQTKQKIGCQVVAGLIQYFLLATFCWMAVEGINLYRSVVDPLTQRGSGKKKFMIGATLFAVGLPLVITVISAAAEPNNYGPLDENDSYQFCLVRNEAFYYGALLPICLILLMNFVCLIMVMRGIYEHNTSSIRKEMNRQTQLQMIMGQARVAFSCSVLLGITWLFGVMAIGDLRLFFQILFCIFNSLQGFFIFLFYAARNPDVRKEWLSCCGARKDKSQPPSRNEYSNPKLSAGAQQNSPVPSKNESNLVRRAQLSFKTFRKPKHSAGEQLTLSDEVKSESNV